MATAAAVALSFGLGTVAFASIGGADLLGMSTDPIEGSPPSEVQEIQNVVVVVSGSSTTVAGEAVATDPAVDPAAVPAGPAVLAEQPSSEQPSGQSPVVVIPSPWTTVANSSAPVTTAKSTSTSAAKPTITSPATVTTAKPASTTATTDAPVTTAKPVVTTTTAKPVTTTTARPRGVPADWPADKPIPPMPAGCKDPQLELNGVWNCDD